MLLATLLTLATVHAAATQDQDAPVYETEVENVLNRLQIRQINAGTTGDWGANPFAIGPVGWFLKSGRLTRNGWRLGDIPDPNSSEIIYSLNTSMPEPYVAAIVQNPNQPEYGLPVSTSYYSTVHATYPTSSGSETSTEVVNRDTKHNKRDSLDLFDGPFEAIPWVNHFFTVFSDGCASSSTLTTTTTDATGNTTTWTDTLSTDFVQIQHDFPSDIVLPFTFNQTTEPFVGSISGVVRESPIQIALATGPDAPSLYSYYQIVSSFCGTQDDD
ncbi:hypothetical protein B0H19DRAFT_1183092 [Mycena capillaripes]|nr:hypothetical protein B0H19DRAFT_1183092 [Mycena capillaripes]